MNMKQNQRNGLKTTTKWLIYIYIHRKISRQKLRFRSNISPIRKYLSNRRTFFFFLMKINFLLHDFSHAPNLPNFGIVAHFYNKTQHMKPDKKNYLENTFCTRLDHWMLLYARKTNRKNKSELSFHILLIDEFSFSPFFSFV